ncbi:MAG: hypothetical protein ACR2J8_03540 [Thermomicrobiales bacterium]
MLISAAALAQGWCKDHQFHRREFADTIRAAAGRVAVSLERWQILARQLCDTLQPTMLDAARIAADEGDSSRAAHTLRTALLHERAVIAARIADARIEAAYVDLYG